MALPSAPYRGIEPFRYVDHRIFFARQQETRHLASLVTIYRGVMLYGDSGSGKSSLINAGLLPRAAELELAPERLRVQPRAGEELVVERIATAEQGGETLPSLLAGGDGDAAVVVSVATCERRVREACESGARPLIIFDQFEEIITLFERTDAHDDQQAIVAMIMRLLHGPLAVKLLFVFREDYLAKIKELLSAAPDLVDQALRLAPPPAASLTTIIRGPFDAHPGSFAHELSAELAEQLSGTLAERFGSGELSLSEVQIVCLRLWNADDPQQLLAERGVQGLLEDHLAEALEALGPQLRYVAVVVLGQMITEAGTRNVISAEDVVLRAQDEHPELSAEVIQDALGRLESEARLVRRERRRDLYLYEIASEFLVPWIAKRREELRHHDERLRSQRLQRSNKRLAAAVATLLAILVGLIAQSAGSGPLRHLELGTVDMRFALRGDRAADPRIVIVGRDGRTLDLGRATQARVLDRVAAGRPAAIVETFEFDAPASEDNGGKAATAALMRAVHRARDRVLLGTSRVDNSGLTTLFGLGVPARFFAGARAGYGDFPLEADGAVRRIEYEGRQPGAYATAGMPTLAVRAAALAGTRVHKGDVPSEGAWIDLAGGPGSYRQVSYADVLDGTARPASFRDRIVVLGAANADAASLRTAADTTKRMAPVELQANAIATMRAGQPLRDAAAGLSIALIVALAALASLLALRLPALVAIALCLGIGMLFAVAAQLAFNAGWVLTVVPPLLALVVATLANPVGALATRIGRRATRRGARPA